MSDEKSDAMNVRGFRMPDSLWKKIKRRAVIDRTTTSQVARNILEDYFENRYKKNKKPR